MDKSTNLELLKFIMQSIALVKRRFQGILVNFKSYKGII